jgi:hypothetical protein
MSTPVTRQQFVVTSQGVTHVPTGASFTPHSGSLNTGSMYLGQLGNVLKNDDDHRPDQVKAMMQQMWQEYVHENPDLFAK